MNSEIQNSKIECREIGRLFRPSFIAESYVSLLEPVCCKKRQKIVPEQLLVGLVTGLGNKGPLKVLNGSKLILDDHGNNLDSFRISL